MLRGDRVEHARSVQTSDGTEAQGLPTRESPTKTLTGIPTFVVNKVGTYRLVALKGDRVRYRFENRWGQQTEADVPLVIWREMAEKSQRKEAA